MVDELWPADGPFPFTVDGRSYTGTMAGRFFDVHGAELPYEVGAELHRAAL